MIKNTEINMIELQDFSLKFTREQSSFLLRQDKIGNLGGLLLLFIIYHIICILLSYVLIILNPSYL